MASLVELLKLSPDIFNDLSKIKILFNEAYNNNKITLAYKDNNIKLIIKIVFNSKEIDCPIELVKENLGIIEKIKFMLEYLEKLKNNKNILLMNEYLLEIENNLKYLQNSITKILNIGMNINEEKKDNNLENIVDNKKSKIIKKELQQLKNSKIIENENKDEFNQSDYIKRNKMNDKQHIDENENYIFNNTNEMKKYGNNNNYLEKDVFTDKNIEKIKSNLSKKEVNNFDIKQINQKKDNLSNIKNQKKDEINTLKELKNIESQINKNYELLELKKDEDMNVYFYEECYLINKEWLNYEINKYKKKEDIKPSKSIDLKMTPRVKEEEQDWFKYPTDFGFIDKKNYESIIKDLINKDKDINIEDFFSALIFFVNYQNNIPREKKDLYPNQKFIGIKIENNIFFYKPSKFTFIFEFLISYENEGIINTEIQKYLIKKGIGSYINDRGVDFSVKYFNLIDYELNEIGFCVNFNINKRHLYKSKRTKLLKDIENSSSLFYNILQCLVNIKEFKNFYFEKKQLFDLIDNNSIFSKYIYKIVLDMWNTGDEENNNQDIYENLKKK